MEQEIVDTCAGAGQVKNQRDLGIYPFQMALLDETYLGDVVNLWNVVMDSLYDRDLLLPLPPEVLRRDLGESGFTLGAFVNGRLMAFRSVHFPGGGEDNLGREIGLPEDDLESVMQLQAALVHPDYRGNSVQKKMTGRLIKFIRDSGRGYRYCCSQVSPKNCPSLLDKFVQNLLVARLSLKYGSYWRCIFFQDLENPLRPSAGEAVPVYCRDLDRQMELISRGYFGFRLEKRGDGCAIMYAPCDGANKILSGLRR